MRNRATYLLRVVLDSQYPYSRVVARRQEEGHVLYCGRMHCSKPGNTEVLYPGSMHTVCILLYQQVLQYEYQSMHTLQSSTRSKPPALCIIYMHITSSYVIRTKTISTTSQSRGIYEPYYQLVCIRGSLQYQSRVPTVVLVQYAY